MKVTRRLLLCSGALLISAVVLASSVGSPLPETNSTNSRSLSVDPQWQSGDRWRIKYTYELESPAKDPISGAGIEMHFFYAYTVQPDTTHPSYPGIRIAKILVESEDGLEDWELLFDREQLCLLHVEEVVPTEENLVYINPFGTRSWMARLDEYSGIIIHDFPKLRGQSKRDVRPSKTGTPAFEQEVIESFSAIGRLNLTAVFQRTDPVSSKLHRTKINWQSGAKWWNNAVISLDGEVMVRGELL